MASTAEWDQRQKRWSRWRKRMRDDDKIARDTILKLHEALFPEFYGGREDLLDEHEVAAEYLYHTVMPAISEAALRITTDV